MRTLTKRHQSHVPHDHAIRSKLLNSLGIYKTVPIRSPENRRKHCIRTVGGTSQHRSLEISTYRLPLNDQADSHTTASIEKEDILVFSNMEQEQPLAFSPGSSSSFRVPASAASSTSSQYIIDRSIQFQDEVVVVPIPSHNDYSDRIKRFIWSGAEELSKQVERNRAEFAAEGWDVNFVVEEDDMYIDANNGQLIHPVWLDEEEGEEECDDHMMMDEDQTELPKLTRSGSFCKNLTELSHCQ